LLFLQTMLLFKVLSMDLALPQELLQFRHFLSGIFIFLLFIPNLAPAALKSR
jgi:hypothetical protein